MLQRFFYFISLLFVSVVFSQNSLIPFRDGKKWGFCDTLGKIVVKPYLDTIHDVRYDYFFKNAAFLVEKNKKKFVVNESNQLVLPVINAYDSIRLKEFDVKYIEVYKKGKLGIVKDLKEKVPCLYDEVVVAANASYYVYIGKKCGLINENKKLVIPVRFDEISPIGEEVIAGKNKFGWEAILADKPQKFYDAIQTEEGQEMVVGTKELARGSYYSDKELIQIKNELSKKFTYVELKEYDDIAIIGNSKSQLGVYSLEKKSVIINPQYEFIEFAGEDSEKRLFKVKYQNKWGLVDEDSKVFLPIQYDSVDFNSRFNLFIISLNNKVGFKILNTIYPTVEPKYLKIIKKHSLQVNDSWNFSLLQVLTEKGYGFVGENGVEYFKD